VSVKGTRQIKSLVLLGVPRPEGLQNVRSGAQPAMRFNPQSQRHALIGGRATGSTQTANELFFANRGIGWQALAASSRNEPEPFVKPASPGIPFSDPEPDGVSLLFVRPRDHGFDEVSRNGGTSLGRLHPHRHQMTMPGLADLCERCDDSYGTSVAVRKEPGATLDPRSPLVVDENLFALERRGESVGSVLESPQPSCLDGVEISEGRSDHGPFVGHVTYLSGVALSCQADRTLGLRLSSRYLQLVAATRGTATRTWWARRQFANRA